MIPFLFSSIEYLRFVTVFAANSVRFGFAAGCAAWLCLAGEFTLPRFPAPA
jgi:hypothetical protein